ncbi:dnaJ protein [Cinnamomum micranthum f. kanehirae]|uniref:DnaJ protein n=1 Tax=Cinnamomum micranthum f. kanehirae TaxID=337451 RepID=A0A443NUL7_9MAGN|nr:dnaJ protein [Cinnamomum micranthum f. kanehirae]
MHQKLQGSGKLTECNSFDELAVVHEVLIDPAKRNIYDQHGEDALKEGMGGGGGHHHPFHVFQFLLQSTFYEGNPFGGSVSSQGLRKRMGEDVILPLQVSLEEQYNGFLDASSANFLRLQQGISMIQQMQHLCNECKGTGETPETVAGDTVFVLQQKEHAKFKRNRHDLYVEHTVPLTEALCGFQFLLTHLDNRQLLIKSNPGEVLMPGMPMYLRPFMRGKLYLQFTVDFPRSLTSDQCKTLGTILPPRASVQLKDQLKDRMLGECEETTLY